MQTRSGRKCCPRPASSPARAAPRRRNLSPLARLSGFHSSSIPSNRFKIVMRGGWGVSLRCPPPPTRRRGPLCFMLAAHASSPPRARSRAPSVFSGCCRRSRSSCIFQHGRASCPDTSPTRLPEVLPCQVSDLSVRASVCPSVVVLGSFRQALCSCVITGLRKLLQLYNKCDSR